LPWKVLLETVLYGVTISTNPLDFERPRVIGMVSMKPVGGGLFTASTAMLRLDYGPAVNRSVKGLPGFVFGVLGRIRELGPAPVAQEVSVPVPVVFVGGPFPFELCFSRPFSRPTATAVTDTAALVQEPSAMTRDELVYLWLC
jgi:hypothetical protein